MRDFFGDLHCACLSFDLVLAPVTTPDDRMDVTGHWVTCVGCSESFHDWVEAQPATAGPEPTPPPT